MRVLLIRPNSTIKAVPMPLGLGYLSAALKAQGHQVQVLDARLERLPHDQVPSRLREFKPDAVGLSALSFDGADAHTLARAIKNDFPQVPLIVGGPYASARGEPILDDPAVDYLVLGEGEITLPELLDAIEQGRDLSEVAGIIFRKDETALRTPAREPVMDLDSLKVDWEALNPQAYFSSWQRTAQNSIQYTSRVASIFTSRGCPYGCIYCHNIFGRKFRPRSPESVIDEMKYLTRKFGIHEFEIADDAFNLDMDRAKSIARLIIKSGLMLHLAFPNGLRADKIDEELLDLLKAAGTFRINYAVESASPRIQKMIGKAMDLELAKKSIAQTAARGMVTAGYFILGFPDETEQEMQMTVDYATCSDLHIASFFYLCPFPGTKLAESYPELAEQARKMQFSDYTAITVNLSAVSDDQMSAICKKTYRSFYFNPRRMLRILKVVPKNMRTLTSVLDVIRLSAKDSVNY